MQENTICPGCGRYCNLERPHCGRGEEYRRTGKMPEHQGKRWDQEMYTANDSAAGIDDRLIISLQDLHHIMRSLYEGKASQKRILIILNESEAITQRDLTERLVNIIPLGSHQFPASEPPGNGIFHLQSHHNILWQHTYLISL